MYRDNNSIHTTDKATILHTHIDYALVAVIIAYRKPTSCLNKRQVGHFD